MDIAFISKYIHLLGVAGGHASNSSENDKKKVSAAIHCLVLPSAAQATIMKSETGEGTDPYAMLMLC